MKTPPPPPPPPPAHCRTSHSLPRSQPSSELAVGRVSQLRRACTQSWMPRVTDAGVMPRQLTKKKYIRDWNLKKAALDLPHETQQEGSSGDPQHHHSRHLPRRHPVRGLHLADPGGDRLHGGVVQEGLDGRGDPRLGPIILTSVVLVGVIL